VNNERKRVAGDLEEQRKRIEDNENHTKHARQMSAFLTAEAKKLLSIGSPDRVALAARVDLNSYDAIRRHVEGTFGELLDKVRQQNEQMIQLAKQRVSRLPCERRQAPVLLLQAAADQEEVTKKVALERELAVKQARVDAARETLAKLGAQNDFLRQQLVGGSPSSSSDFEAVRQIRTVQETATSNQAGALDAQMKRARAHNEEARFASPCCHSMINQSTNGI